MNNKLSLKSMKEVAYATPDFTKEDKLIQVLENFITNGDPKFVMNDKVRAYFHRKRNSILLMNRGW